MLLFSNLDPKDRSLSVFECSSAVRVWSQVLVNPLTKQPRANVPFPTSPKCFNLLSDLNRLGRLRRVPSTGTTSLLLPRVIPGPIHPNSLLGRNTYAHVISISAEDASLRGTAAGIELSSCLSIRRVLKDLDLDRVFNFESTSNQSHRAESC